jgi:predicted membrane-bound dolichyl-phosphate-mannose-protein mannosyltransferase
LGAQAGPIITAGLRPELFAEAGEPSLSRSWLIVILAFLMLAGFGLRARSLSAESLSEDELNKLYAVEDYRAHGLTAANGEHPFLMKAMLWVSVVAVERWNQTLLAEAHTSLRVPVETALRLPCVILGALTILLIYLLTKELFGTEVALMAAALLALDPSAIAFNRIAKEDTFVIFFFLLANVFWLRGQRVAESGEGKPEPYYWATAAAFGAMMASKYLPYLITVSVSYNYIFQGIPATRWRIGKRRFLIFFVIMGAAFLLCNPPILLPATWREMLAFARYQKIGHDSYEFMGTLYSHRLTDWLRGIPFYFYFVFMAVKLPLATLAAFFIGLPLLFRRRLGDGRYFLFFWTFFWFLFFGITGGKFTRYFTIVLPAVLITAAIGLQFAARLAASRCAALLGDGIKIYVRTALASLLMLCSAWASLSAVPYYRLYTNALGGGSRRAGNYFPQDEFYDAYMREVMLEVGQRAAPGARVASEMPGLAAYYAQQANRPDLKCVPLSDPAALKELGAGDFILVARGRRYFSNDALIASLHQTTAPAFRVSLGTTTAVEVYILDGTTLKILTPFAR